MKNSQDCKIIKLADGAELKYYKNFLLTEESTDLYQFLVENIPWKHGIYKMFGKDVKTPRVLYAMKNKNTDITDVYTVTESMIWTPEIKKIKKKLEKLTEKEFRYAQLNYYRDGNDYIGYHTDSEVQHGDIIASISLGTSRQFVFRHIDYKTNKIKKYEMTLESGSLLIMNEEAAKLYWKHSIPKAPKIKTGRINITFRPN